jgi:hypothetical protein
MSRPQKIMPPIKGTFMEIITAVADGKGVPKPPPHRHMANERKFDRSADKTPPPKR